MVILIIVAIIVFIVAISKRDFNKIRDINKLDHVIDNIYIGNWYDSINEKKLLDSNIKAIITLNGSYENIHTDDDVKMFKRLGIINKRININDNAKSDIKQYFKECIEFIEKHKNKNILVHCTAGISRSASIVLAYLIICKNMSYNDSYLYLKNIRNIINPNKAFKVQLQSLI